MRAPSAPIGTVVSVFTDAIAPAIDRPRDGLRRQPVAMLLIDVINELSFPEAPALIRYARPMARAIKYLKRRVKAAGIPVIYVNDNFGRWRSDFRGIVRHCSRRDSLGREMVQLLAPEPDDYFVLKPRHSGFYASSLDTILSYLGSKRLIITGLTTPQCVFFTAIDAHMREFQLLIPRDCVAAAERSWHTQSLRFMKRFFSADVRPSRKIVLNASSGHALCPVMSRSAGNCHRRLEDI